MILGGGWIVRDHVQIEPGKGKRTTYIKESLVTRVLWGSHAGASRDDHFYLSQINVAFTACVLTRVIVSQLEPKRYVGYKRHRKGKQHGFSKCI